jgi:hypothetical protein
VVYVRSIIAGMMALVLAAVLFQVIVFALAVMHVSYGNERWMLQLHWHVAPIDWLPPIIIFGAGFYSEYRRLSRQPTS